jgi:hypothetical protein
LIVRGIEGSQVISFTSLTFRMLENRLRKTWLRAKDEKAQLSGPAYGWRASLKFVKAIKASQRPLGGGLGGSYFINYFL